MSVHKVRIFMLHLCLRDNKAKKTMLCKMLYFLFPVAEASISLFSLYVKLK